MKLEKIIEILEAKAILDFSDLDLDIEYACGADLMSDVLAFFTPGSMLLTGLTQPQVIRTAEIVNIKVVVFIRNKNPEKETVELAKEKKIPLLVTPLSMFSACGRLYREGLRSCPKRQ